MTLETKTLLNSLSIQPDALAKTIAACGALSSLHADIAGKALDEIRTLIDEGATHGELVLIRKALRAEYAKALRAAQDMLEVVF